MGITTERARTLTRWSAVAVMAVAVVTATADGFAQSYAGLYEWALNHGLSGWKASSFPLMVDLLIVVGELGLFLLAIDAYSLQRKHFLTWFDFLLPLLIAIAGWTTSVIFNVGHVTEREFSYQATAAVPPIVSMLGLLVLLRTLHRYVSDRPPGRRLASVPAGQRVPSDLATAEVPAEAPAEPVGTSPAQLAAQPAAGSSDGSAGQPADGPTVRLVRLPETFTRPAERRGSGEPDLPAEHRGNGEPDPPAEQRELRERPRVAERPDRGEPDGSAERRERGEPDGPAEHREPDESAAWPRPANDAPANGQGRGHSDVQGNGQSRPSPVAREQAAAREQATRDRVLEELHNHGGKVPGVLAALADDGLTYDEEEAYRVRTNVWLPYVVYRLLAQHGGDVNKVSRALEEKRIDCEYSVLDDLARSWQ